MNDTVEGLRRELWSVQPRGPGRLVNMEIDELREIVAYIDELETLVSELKEAETIHISVNNKNIDRIIGLEALCVEIMDRVCRLETKEETSND